MKRRHADGASPLRHPHRSPPPVIPWNGASRALAVPAGDPWVTPSEATAFRTTPRYDETVAYLRRLVAASPNLKMISLGKSAEGRDVWMVIASKERAFTPEALRRANKPIVFGQGGIHSGEIDMRRSITIGSINGIPEIAARPDRRIAAHDRSGRGIAGALTRTQSSWNVGPSRSERSKVTVC